MTEKTEGGTETKNRAGTETRNRATYSTAWVRERLQTGNAFVMLF